MKRGLILFALVGLLAFGCADTATETSEATDAIVEDAEGELQVELSAEELGRLSAEISQDPDNAQEILSEHGLTEEEFEARIRETAANPEASDEYAAAFRSDETGS